MTAQRPAVPGIYPTRASNGMVLYRRFDGRRWYFGDRFKSNAAGAMQALPFGRVPELVEDWSET